MPDLKLALRHLARRKLFAASSVLLLAVGLGLAGILATIIRDVMISPLPYRGSDRLILLAQEFPSRNGEDGAFSAFDIVELQAAELPALEGLGALDYRPASMREGDSSERVWRTVITRSCLEMMGIPPQKGRLFLPEEMRPGALPVALLSHRLWANRFASDPGIVGRTIVLDHVTHTIVGVMPPRFTLWGAEVWTPLVFDPAPSPAERRQATVLAIVREGVGFEQARAQFQRHFDAIAEKIPAGLQEYRGRRARIYEMLPLVLRNLEQTLLLLATVVGLLLVLTAINFGALTFLRVSSMRDEIAVRVALGATRGRLAFQLFAEIGLLATAGGFLALLIVRTGVPLFVSLTPATYIPSEALVQVDAGMLAATFGGALLLALVAAAVPVLVTLGGPAERDLAGVARVHRGSPRTRRIETAIVVAEVALAFAILLCTAAVALTFARKLEGDGGFAPGAVTTFRMLLPPTDRAEPDAQRVSIRRAETALETLPGVSAAAIAQYRPMIEIHTRQIVLPGRDPAAAEGRVSAHYRAVTAGYLATTGMRLRQGRFVEPGDDATGSRIAVINETFARLVSPGGDVLGQTLVLVPRNGGDETPLPVTIVGVTANTLQAETRRPGPHPEIFVPLAQADTIPFDLAVLARGPSAVNPPASMLMEAIRRSLGSDTSFYSPEDFDGLTSQLLAQHRLGAFILSVLGIAALAIAALGLYSLLAYSLARRTREMGIRQALGATPRELLWLFFLRGLRLTVGGLLLGALVFRLVIPQIGARVAGSTGFDPAGVALSLATLLFVAALASLIPGLRAARTDPMLALRRE